MFHNERYDSSAAMLLYIDKPIILIAPAGYDGSLMGSINAVPSYTKYYNLPPEGNSGTGLVFAIFNVGQMAGALFIWVADWKGRRWPIFVGCVGVCVGGEFSEALLISRHDDT